MALGGFKDISPFGYAVQIHIGPGHPSNNGGIVAFPLPDKFIFDTILVHHANDDIISIIREIQIVFSAFPVLIRIIGAFIFPQILFFCLSRNIVKGTVFYVAGFPDMPEFPVCQILCHFKAFTVHSFCNLEFQNKIIVAFNDRCSDAIGTYIQISIMRCPMQHAIEMAIRQYFVCCPLRINDLFGKLLPPIVGFLLNYTRCIGIEKHRFFFRAESSNVTMVGQAGWRYSRNGDLYIFSGNICTFHSGDTCPGFFCQGQIDDSTAANQHQQHGDNGCNQDRSAQRQDFLFAFQLRDCFCFIDKFCIYIVQTTKQIFAVHTMIPSLFR